MQGEGANVLAISLKDPTVSVDRLTPDMARGMIAVFAVLRRRGIPTVITSGDEAGARHAAHSARHPRSLHYEGRAVDVRLPSRYTKDPATDHTVCAQLVAVLGSDFDVVLERDHLHVEHDPRDGAGANA